MAASALNLPYIYLIFLCHCQCLGHANAEFAFPQINRSLVDENSTFENRTPDYSYEGSGCNIHFGPAVLIPVTLLSVFGNVLSFVVWSAAPAFNPTIFFMKALALTDSAYVLFLIAIEEFIFIGRSVTTWKFGIQFLSAHTTLGLVFTRWVVVRKPMDFARLVTKCRVVALYTTILLWSIVGTVVLFTVTWFREHNPRFADFLVVFAVWVVLPVLAILVLNVDLIRLMRAHRARLGQQQQQQQADAQRDSQLHRLLAAVVSMSVTTVLTFPVGIALEGTLVWRVFHIPQLCGYLLNDVAATLQLFNSSVNVLYYLIFATHFRQLFRKVCCCCCCCCCRR